MTRATPDERPAASDEASDGRGVSPARRKLLVGAAATGLLPFTAAVRAGAGIPMPDIAAMREVVGGRSVTRAKVTLDLPALADNGNTVPASIAIDSPMTDADHVRRIWLFSDRNPRPTIAEFTLGPWSGRAAVSTRVRLAGTQHVVALAETTDGRLWADVAEVIVTQSACVDES